MKMFGSQLISSCTIYCTTSTNLTSGGHAALDRFHTPFLTVSSLVLESCLWFEDTGLLPAVTSFHISIQRLCFIFIVTLSGLDSLSVNATATLQPRSVCRWLWGWSQTWRHFCVRSPGHRETRCQIQMRCRDVLPVKCIMMDCANPRGPRWLRVVQHSVKQLGRERKSHIGTEHFISVSRVPGGKALPKYPPFPAQWAMAKTSFRCPVGLYPYRINGCFRLRLTESGYLIPLVHYGGGHHLLAVRVSERTTAPSDVQLGPVLTLPVTSQIWPDLPPTHHLLSSERWTNNLSALVRPLYFQTLPLHKSLKCTEMTCKCYTNGQLRCLGVFV